MHSFIKNVSFWAQLYFHFNLIISLRICNSLYYCCCSGWTFCGSCTWYHVGCMVLCRSVFFFHMENFNYSIHSILFYFIFLKILNILTHTQKGREENVLKKLIVVYIQNNVTLGYIIQTLNLFNSQQQCQHT